MTQRTNWFQACLECRSTEPNPSGVCASCEAKHGYANDNRAPASFTGDVDASSREPKEIEL
ncbi:hypothetical protein [Sphingobium amiense]|uniref:hypothetical protein n=1 Tax=Sphingobium amiense TaxID=135719 RepID=UPI00082C84A5|nr:hypothetical protein [Sphingobium amiense]